ncbi:MAG: transglycosylase SLT domain-containing protein [Flavobacteriales bacterium]|nr:transglycosylase SLT domain-containing protein [Flavobacteriales bacterium]
MKDRWVLLIGVVAIAAAVALQVWKDRGQPSDAHALPWEMPLVDRDLEQIKADTLRVLMLRDPLTWEQRPEAETGLEFELLERYARWAKLKLKVVPVDHPDSLLLWLQQGRGDVAAAQLDPSSPKKRFIAFSKPYQQVAPVLVALRADPLTRKARRKGEQAPDTILLSRWSPFERAAVDLAARNGVKPVLYTSYGTPEEVLVDVVLGRRPGAVISDAAAMTESKRFPHLSFGPRVGPAVDLAFGLRTNAKALRRSINNWLVDKKERAFMEELIGSVEGSVKQRGAFVSTKNEALATDTISPFDSLFQLHADSLSMDWRMLAAVAFKESRFDTSALSSAGAEGLMQMMPETAASLGVDAKDGVSGQVRGASRYLAELDTIWRGTVPAADQRMKFVLASYNSGPGHIKDAQKLARELDLDPSRWDGNVERALLLLNKPRYFMRSCVKNGSCRGWETFQYVREVGSTFRRYRGAAK